MAPRAEFLGPSLGGMGEAQAGGKACIWKHTPRARLRWKVSAGCREIESLEAELQSRRHWERPGPSPPVCSDGQEERSPQFGPLRPMINRRMTSSAVPAPRRPALLPRVKHTARVHGSSHGRASPLHASACKTPAGPPTFLLTETAIGAYFLWILSAQFGG